MTQRPDDAADILHVHREEGYSRQAKEETAYYDQLSLDRQVSAAGTLTPANGFAVYGKRVEK